MALSVPEIADAASVVFFLPSLFAWPVILVGILRYNKSMRSPVARPAPVPILSVSIFIGAIAGTAILMGVVQRAAQSEIGDFFDRSRSIQVRVEQRSVADSAKALAVLRAVQAIPAHHSHPTNTIDVSLHSERGSLSLRLGRDSNDPHEYWVFYPKYHTTDNNAVYHLITDYFDGVAGV